jgi:hypothetical protein
MNPSAEIFEALAQLPDRTPAQRAADERSAAILRAAERFRGDPPPAWGKWRKVPWEEAS